jgi:hypothetical protein
VYDFDSNMIFAELMKSRSAQDHLAAFKQVHSLLTRCGLKPQLQKLDNEASTVLKTFLQQESIDFQLAPPHVHRRNAAEHAIHTFKNHFIAGLCSLDPKFPIHLWDRLLPQALLTLNLLRGSRINPRLSAYAQVHGAFDFNRMPLAPPGTRVLVHEKPAVRETWAPHAVDGWYIGPAMHHYRCFRVWIAETHAKCISDTLSWFPSHVLMPTASSVDTAIAAVHDLTRALLAPLPASAIAPLFDSEHATLTTLAQIFANRLLSPEMVPDLSTVTTPPSIQPNRLIAPTVETGPVPRVDVLPSPSMDSFPAPRVETILAPWVDTNANFSMPPNIRPSTNSPEPPSILRLSRHRHSISTTAIPQMIVNSHVHFHPSTNAAAPTTLFQRTPCPTLPVTYRQFTQNTGQRRHLQKKLHASIQHCQATAQASATLHHHNTRFRHCNFALAATIFAPALQTLSFCDDGAHVPLRWCANAVIDPKSGNDIPYSKLIKGADAPHWIRATSLEMGRLAQGLRDVLVGTNTMFFIRHDQKPSNKTATYLRIVAAYKEHKAEQYRIRFTAGGDKITYPGNVSTPTVDTTTVKCHLNSVVSTPSAKYMTLDIHNFYLNTPLPNYEYMKNIPAGDRKNNILRDQVQSDIPSSQIMCFVGGLHTEPDDPCRECKVLTLEQIETYQRDGVLVVENILSPDKLKAALSGLRETLMKHGVDDNNLAETGHHLSKLSSTNGSGGVLDIYYEPWQIELFAANATLFQATTELWEAFYCRETSIDCSGEKQWMSHPYGTFDFRRGYMYLDRLGYRLPTQLAHELGKKSIDVTSTTRRPAKKFLPIQRSLTPHLDCCPSDMFSESQKKWRPIQCFVALTDALEPNQGGFEAAKGFHREFHSWAVHRPPSRNTSSTVVTTVPAPCVGEYTHIRPQEDADVMKRIEHVPVPAGSAVFWDIR